MVLFGDVVDDGHLLVDLVVQLVSSFTNFSVLELLVWQHYIFRYIIVSGTIDVVHFAVKCILWTGHKLQYILSKISHTFSTPIILLLSQIV